MPRAKPFSSSFNRSFRIKPCCLAFPSPRRSPGRPIARTIGRKSYRFTSSRRAPGTKGSRVRQLSRAGARARALPSGSLPGRAVCARDRPRVFAHRRGGRDPRGGGTLGFFCCGISLAVCGLAGLWAARRAEARPCGAPKTEAEGVEFVATNAQRGFWAAQVPCQRLPLARDLLLTGWLGRSTWKRV